MSCMFFSRCLTAHDRKFARIFGMYGRFLSRYPWLVIIVSIFINLICGIGILKFDFDPNLDNQYHIANSDAFKNREFIRNNFKISENNFRPYALPDLGCFGEIFIQGKKGRSIFDEPVLTEIIDIHNRISHEIDVKLDNVSYKYTDLCAKFQNRCFVYGLEVFSSDFLSNLGRNVTFPIYKHLDLSSILSKTLTENGFLKTANMVRLRYFLVSGLKNRRRISESWVQEFKKFSSKLKTTNIDLTYLYYNDMDEEIEKSGMAEAHLFPLTLVLMIVYASIATSGRRIDCVYGIQYLGRIGVIAALLSIVPSIGIASLMGQKFMSSVATMPFLILGIGINDMFIILSGYANTIHDSAMPIEKRIEYTLMSSGLSITITSLTDVITFLIGYTSIFPALKHFCIYTGIAVLFCYFNQLTILTPCLVIHQRQIDKKHHSCTCKTTKSKEHLRKEGRSKCYIACCSGTRPSSRKDMESVLETFPKRVAQFIVTHGACRVLVFLVYIAYLVFSIMGAKDLKQQSKYSDLSLVGSNYYTANVWDYENYPLELPVQLVFPTSLDYSSPETQLALNNLVERLKNSSLVNGDQEISWISSFLHSKKYTTKSFYSDLHQFINGTQVFKDDVVFSADNHSIVSSRIFLFSENIRTSELQAKFLVSTREIVESSALDCFIYSPVFKFFEQWENMIGSTLQTVGIAVSAMFVVACVFIPHPTIVFIVTISMLSILLGVFGFLKHWGLDISVVTMVELVISVGFSVDFSAHICHAYISSPSHDRHCRVLEALELAGGPTINGALSTIIGISLLNLSKSFIFQSFFKVLFLVVFFGMIHGIIIVPIVLYYIGPKVRILPKPDKSNLYGANNLKPNIYDIELSVPVLIDSS